MNKEHVGQELLPGKRARAHARARHGVKNLSNLDDLSRLHWFSAVLGQVGQVGIGFSIGPALTRARGLEG